MASEHKANRRKSFAIMSSLSVVVFLSLVFTIMPLNQVDASDQTEFRGKDYKDVDLGNGQHVWTGGLSPYTIDKAGQYVPYLFTETDSEIQVITGSGSIVLDKITCEFKLYESDSLKQLVIDGYEIEFFKDDIKQTSSCSVSSVVVNQESLTFSISSGELTTKFDINPNGIEWTYEITNNEGKSTDFKIIETCKNCIPDEVTPSNKIIFRDYILDPKNEEHGTLKQIDTKNGQVKIEFEKNGI